MIGTLYKKITRTVITLTLLISFISVPVMPVFDPAPNIAHAGGFEIVWDPWNDIVNTITSIATNSLWIKEYILDPILWMAMNLLLEAITDEIVRWINSGFEGAPAFVQDLDKFLLNWADSVAGNLIYGSDLGFLCSPFELDLRAALHIQYYEHHRDFKNEVKCKLSDVVDNVENFASGDFLQGGWNGWFEMTAVPSNNPYGALVMAQGEMRARVVGAEGRELAQLAWGEGLLSLHKCSEDENGAPQDCQIVTPGAVIEDQLNRTLGIETNRLTIADEINEILGALLNQIVKQALGAVGLFSANTAGTGPAQTDYSGQTPEGVATSEGANDLANAAIGVQEEGIALYQEMIDLAVEAETEVENICGAPDAVSLPTELIDARNEAEIEIIKLEGVIAEIQSLLAQANSAQSAFERSQIYDQAAEIEGGVSEEDVEQLEIEVERLRSIQSEFIAGLEEACV